MSKIPRSKWTTEEREMDRLVEKSESRNQVTRIAGRLALDEFIKKHGKEACDKMWERIK